MIRQYREKRSLNELNVNPRKEISTLEWDGLRPYRSLSILANWAGPGANGCYLDGLERGQAATGILVFRGPVGLVTVGDGDFITKHGSDLMRHRRSDWLNHWELVKETTEDRVAL